MYMYAVWVPKTPYPAVELVLEFSLSMIIKFEHDYGDIRVWLHQYAHDYYI